MSTAVETLWQALNAGLQLWVEGDQLRFRGGKGALTEELRAGLKAHKPELLRIIGPDRKLCLTALAQQRLWFLQQLDPDSPAYNLPAVSRLQGELRVATLAAVLTRIVARHESLRTIFTTIAGFTALAGQVAQAILPARPVPLPVIDLSQVATDWGSNDTALKLAEALASREVQRPFDLAVGPLARFHLLRMAANDHALVINIHHSVYDGWSVGLLLGELVALYNAETGTSTEVEGPPVPELPIQYADYALWQRQQLQGAALERLLDYWRGQIPRQAKPLTLPGQLPGRGDNREDNDAAFRGEEVLYVLPAPLREGLEALARRLGVSLPVVLLAGFQALLHAYTGAREVTLGQPTANRTRHEVEALIGFFANIVVLHTDLSGNPSFGELLARTRETARGAAAHQELPFDRLVEELAPERDAGQRNPLFQIFFAVQNAPRGGTTLEGLQLQPMRFSAQVTRFDLEVHLTPGGTSSEEGILCHVIYSTALLERGAMERLPRHLQRVFEQVARQPELRLAEIDVLTRAEQQQLIDWTDGTTSARASVTHDAILTGFEARAKAEPNQPVLIDSAGAVDATLGQLWSAATNGGAASLRAWLDVGALPALLDVVRPYSRILGPTGRRAPVGVWGHLSLDIDGDLLDDHIFEARWRENGTILLRLAQGRPAARLDEYRLWRRGVLVDVRRIERALLDLRIGEIYLSGAAVRPRQRLDGRVSLVAWVTASVALSSERLQRAVREGLASALGQSSGDERWQLDACLQVGWLPITDDGGLDLAFLEQVEVPTARLRQRWRARLEQTPGLGEAAVVEVEVRRGLRRLHRDDLLPTWPSASMAVTGEDVPRGSVEAAAGADRTRDPVGALADGGPLELPEDAPRTLGAALLRTAEEHPEHGIVYISADGTEEFQSYVQLRDEALSTLAALRQRNLVERAYVVLQFSDLRLHLTTFWACILGGFIPVTVAVPPTYEGGEASNAVVLKLLNTWRLLGHATVLTQRSLEPALRRLSAAPPITTIAVDEGTGLASMRLPPAVPRKGEASEVAFLQLTSGSTGIPKCIQETHHGIAHHIEGSRRCNGNTASDVTLNWLPLDHVVPMLTYHVKDVYLGCRQVQLAGERVFADPLTWLDAMAAHGVTHSWAPNFGFKLVSDALARVATIDSGEPARRWDLSKVRKLMNAGEQVTLPVVAEFLQRTAAFGLTADVMQPAYGMAELCTAMTYRNQFSVDTGAFRCRKVGLGEEVVPTTADDPLAVDFIDVGPPIAGVRLRVIDGQGRPLPENVVGRLQVAGEIVTPGYLDNEAANREAFPDLGQREETGGERWFHTGDLAFLRGGHLAITGREKEVIIVRGANFYCYEIEDLVSSVDGVAATFAAACAVADPATGTEGLALFFVPEETQALEGGQVSARLAGLTEAVRTAVTQRLGISPSHVLPLDRSQFPKTTSGKIQRTRLSAALETGDFDDLKRQLDLCLGSERTVPAWFYRRVWRRSSFGGGEFTTSGRVHVLVPAEREGATTGDHLLELLRQRGVESERVRLDSASELEKFSIKDVAPGDTIVDFCAWRPDASGRSAEELEAEQTAWVTHVLRLARYLRQVAMPGESPPGPPVHLLVATSDCQHIGQGNESGAVGWVFAGLGAVLKTLGQEQTWVRPQHVDFAPETAPGELAEQLVWEIAEGGRDEEVAWREGQRWVPRLSTVPVDRGEEVDKIGGVGGGRWLVTGGAGGLGSLVASTLLTNDGFGGTEVRLLLIGRRPADHPQVAEQLRKLRVLAARSSRDGSDREAVGYAAVDVTDGAALEAAVVQAEAQWGEPLSGVLHLAGTYHEAQLVDESVDGFLDAWRPKALAAWHLRQLLASRPNARLVAFSSVNSVFGGHGVGAYAAANASLDALVRGARRGGVKAQTLAWSAWQDVGMSQGFAGLDAARARGFLPVTAEAGRISLLAALGQRVDDWLIGLDERQPHVRQWLAKAEAQARHAHRHAGELRVWQLAAAGVRTETASAMRGDAELLDGPHLPEDPGLLDPWGTPVRGRAFLVDAIPRLADRGLDEAALARHLAERLEAEAREGSGLAGIDRKPYVAPRTPLEAQLASLWQELLEGGAPSVYDNFFRLGGHSLLASRLVAEIERRLETPLPVSALFQAPTIEALAQLIEARLRGETTGWSPLVPLQPAGTKAAFFCVAPIMGTVFPYFELAQLLGPSKLAVGRPFIGVQPLGLEPGQQALSRIEEISDYFLAELRRLQPAGPYHLGGWSFGSFVVYEMSRRLREQGEDVALAALIDTPAPLPSQRPSAWLGLRFLVATLLRNFWPWVKDYFALRRSGDRTRRGLLERATLVEVIPEESREMMSNQPQIRAMLRAMQANSEAMRHYQPRPADVRVLLLRTEETWSRSRDETLGWSELAEGGVEVERVSGNHMTLLRQPHVREVAQVLARYL